MYVLYLCVHSGLLEVYSGVDQYFFSFLQRRNSHGVPEFKIRHMMERFEKRVTVESVLASQTSFPSSGSG